MAEDGKEQGPLNCRTRPSLPFLEVTCKRSGKIWRFAYGTEAGFAVKFMNKKSDNNGDLRIPLASYVEAVKEGEIPVIFGPNAPLEDYGPGWKLQTVFDTEGGAKGKNASMRRVHFVEKDTTDSVPQQEKSHSAISFFYIAKILLAFVLIFILGAIFTLFLENLPQLILYMNSSV